MIKNKIFPYLGAKYFVPNYFSSDPTTEETWFDFSKKSIDSSIDLETARSFAVNWAQGVIDDIGLAETNVWKIFKRNLVNKWFGVLERKRFAPGWSVTNALQYAEKFTNHSVRFSLFPDNIANYAKSYLLPVSNRESWEELLASVKNNTWMEMFPEGSSETSICFRRFATEFSDVVVYEAGKGQAMFVFEQERGQHPVVTATKNASKFIYESWNYDPSVDALTLEEISRNLKELTLTYDKMISAKCFALCKKTGIASLSIEGYYRPEESEKLIVVDIDLPFDYLFMAS